MIVLVVEIPGELEVQVRDGAGQQVNDLGEVVAARKMRE